MQEVFRRWPLPRQALRGLVFSRVAAAPIAVRRGMPAQVRARSATPSPQYGKELAKAGDLLDSFLEAKGLPSIKACQTDADMINGLLQRFVAHCRASGERTAFSRAKHGILAVQHRHPMLRGHLGPAWAWVAEWRHKTPPCQPSLPMPEELQG